METPALLRIDGMVEHPLELSHDDLLTWPGSDQILDVSRFQPGRRGDGVALDALLARARPRPEANYLTLHASRDDFHVSIPLGPVRAQCVILYRLGDRPLDVLDGGPFRFFIKDPSACHTSELDDCANVKYLDRIELTARRGRDTRPTDAQAHAELHARQDT